MNLASPRTLIAILLGAMLSNACAHRTRAADPYQPLKPGSTIADFEPLTGIDDQPHRLADYATAKCLVVVFTCNTCPYAVDVEQRLVALDREFKERGVQVVAICSNTIEGDRLPAMRERAQEIGFKFPYLHDTEQVVAKQFTATTTPEFFVLDAKRTLVYRGALDDSPDGKQVKTRYVADAINAVLSEQKPATQETNPAGCRIRFERTRRS